MPVNWRLSDRPPLAVAAVAAGVLVAVVAVTLNLTRLPFLDRSTPHSGYLANASGLVAGDAVEVRGVKVGTVTGLSLAGASVKVDFDITPGVRLGDATSASVEVLNALGTEFLQLVPAGSGPLRGPIPLARTHVTSTLLDDLGHAAGEVQKIDIGQLQEALDVTTTNLSATSAAALRSALGGLSTFSATLAQDAGGLRDIVTQGNTVAGILDQRSGALVDLVGQGDAALQVLQARESDIAALLRGTTQLSQQVSSILQVNRAELTPMLTNLSTIASILSKQDANIEAAIPDLAALSRYVAAASGSGPFVDVVVPTGLLSDSVVAACAHPAPDGPVVGCRP